MKNTKTLSIIFSLAIALTSCSQQRYASRAKVKVDQPTEKTVKKHKEVEATELEASAFEQEEPQHDKVEPITIEPLKKAKKDGVIPSREQAEQKVEELGKELKTQVKKPMKRLRKELNRIEKEDGSPFASKWFKLMILGVIIILIAIILGILIDFIGSLVYLVGAVIFSIGFILWIFEILGLV